MDGPSHSTNIAAHWEDELGLSSRKPPYFFRSLKQLDDLPQPHPQATTIRRAWQDMDLDGMLCFDTAPVVYFKRLDNSDEKEIRRLHQQVWNQGIAPLLVLITDKQVHVYSGLSVPAREDESVGDRNRLVQLLDRAADALEIANFVRRVELGEVFRERSRCFDPKHRVDRHLLDNLAQVRKHLREATTPQIDFSIIHALLGRLIFTCYLVDREVVDAADFRTIGAQSCHNLLDLLTNHTPGKAKKLLYSLFEKLRADFHGDLFDADLDDESKHIAAEHINVLRRFLSDEDLATGQLSLGFSAYDFSFIPIETISAIYERFLDTENANDKRKLGAYYTPRFLAEVALDLALKGFGPLQGKRFLDPSCGSGIFLVGLFNRLAEEWRALNPKTTNDRRAAALIKLLKESIFGVDLNETAGRVAALSLYLALLDQLAPRVIRELQAKGRALPRLICHGPRRTSDEDGGNIFISDFFDSTLDLPSAFDLVVGNPPWTRATGPETLAEAWCEGKNLPVAQRQLAYSFIWKAPQHLRPGASVCFVLPAATLFNHQAKSLRFQLQWLTTCTVDVILNLSDLCFYLFDGADRPAIVARYRPERPNKKASISYVVPKTEYETLRAEVLSVSDLDCIDLRVAELLRDLKVEKAPLAWKQAMWATPRGRKFLDRLDEYKTLDDRIAQSVEEKKPWELGEGFNVLGGGKSIDRPILHQLGFLPTRAVGIYVVSRRHLKAKPRAFDPRRVGKEIIFRAPHALFPHGVSRVGERMKVAFVPFDCSFEHSLRGIHVPKADEDELRFLTCALASPLALYFFFHTAANWGTERAKIHVEEYGRFPYPRPDSKERRAIITEVSTLHRRLEAKADTEPLLASMIDECKHLFDNLVYEYYEVDVAEKALVTDTIDLWIKSATPTRGRVSVPTLEPSTPAQRERYMTTLIRSLGAWISRRGMGITARPIISTTTRFGVLCLTLTDSLERDVQIEQTSSAALDAALKRVGEVLPSHSGSIRQMRDLKMFDENDLYVLKPLSQRYWTDTAALNDADELMMAILEFMRGKD
jgi:hypothetical protein